MEAIETQTKRYIAADATVASKEAPGTAVAPLLVIPVVVHILSCSSKPEQNLNDAAVQTQIDELNLGFRKLRPDVSRVPAAFASLVADGRVNFCLATRDSNGNSTNGITHRYDAPIAGFAYDAMKRASTGGIDAWNTAQYLNIWCCDIPQYYGYAVFPGAAT